jgi:hypothetical protein
MGLVVIFIEPGSKSIFLLFRVGDRQQHGRTIRLYSFVKRAMVCHNVEVYPWLFASTALPQIRLNGVCVAEISGPNPTGPEATFKFRHTLPLNVELTVRHRRSGRMSS